MVGGEGTRVRRDKRQVEEWQGSKLPANPLKHIHQNSHHTHNHFKHWPLERDISLDMNAHRGERFHKRIHTQTLNSIHLFSNLRVLQVFGCLSGNRPVQQHLLTSMSKCPHLDLQAANFSSCRDLDTFSLLSDVLTAW